MLAHRRIQQKRQMIRVESARTLEDECPEGVLGDDAVLLCRARFFKVPRQIHDPCITAG
jgi:hypothetical protein